MKKLAFLAIVFGSGFAAADVMNYDDDQTLTVDCAKDKSVMLSGNDNKVTLTGTCTEVNISGNKNTITGSVKSVKLSGNENTFTLDAVDSVLVSGNKNSITYKATVTKTKKKAGYLNSGNGNKFAKVK